MESIERLNKRLIEYYGYYSDGRPNWRIVFSDDQLEKRWSSYTKDGLELQRPEVQERWKYRQYMQPPCFVLERLTEIPQGVENDLVEKTSYECMWAFYDVNRNPIAPVWPAIDLVVKTVLNSLGQAQGKKYKDPREDLSDPHASREYVENELKAMQEGIFGKEEDTLHNAGNAGIVVPSNYEKGVH